MQLTNEEKATLRAIVSEFETDLPCLKELTFNHTTRLPIFELKEYGKWRWVYVNNTIHYDVIHDLLPT